MLLLTAYVPLRMYCIVTLGVGLHSGLGVRRLDLTNFSQRIRCIIVNFINIVNASPQCRIEEFVFPQFFDREMRRRHMT